MILNKVEGRRNPRARHDSRLTVSGSTATRLHRIRSQRGVLRHLEIPGVSLNIQDPLLRLTGRPTANRWFLPLSSSQWGQTLPTTSVMFPVRTESRGHAQGGKKIPGLNMIEVKTSCTAMKAAWTSKLYKCKDETWTIIPRKYLENCEIEKVLCMNFENEKRLPNKVTTILF